MIKNDWNSLAIFVLATTLLVVLFGGVAGGCFAAGWMIRNFMWVKNINKQLPGIVTEELKKMMAKARLN